MPIVFCASGMAKAGHEDGTIKIFDFETLSLIHTLIAPGYSIKLMAFGADGLRLLDIGGNQCNIW